MVEKYSLRKYIYVELVQNWLNYFINVFSQFSDKIMEVKYILSLILCSYY